MNSFDPVQSDKLLQVSFTHDAAEQLLKTVSNLSLHPSINELVEKLKAFIKTRPAAPALSTQLIPVYEHPEDVEQSKSLTLMQWLATIRRFPDYENHWFSVGIDVNGDPTGFVILPFLRVDELSEILSDPATYSLIRQEKQILIIVRLQRINDAGHFKTAYARISNFYCRKFGLTPSVDASDITTKLQLGHDPKMAQYISRPYVSLEQLEIPLDSVIQPNEMTDDVLIIKVNALIQEGYSQRKIGQELGISQPRISRLIAKSKE